MYVICLGSIMSFLALSALIEVSLPNRKRRVKCPAVIYLLISGAIIAIAAFRYGIGYDFFSYRNIFYIVNRSHNVSIYRLTNRLNIEIGYIWLNRVLPTFQMLIFVVAVSCVGTKLYYIYKYSDYCALTLMLYFCGAFLNYDMGVLRQGIAFSCFFIIIDCLNKNKLWMCVLFIVISCLFHITSVIYIPLLIMTDKKPARRTVYIIVIAVSILVALTSISSIAISLLSRAGINIVAAKLKYYSETDTTNNLFSYIKRVIYLMIFTEFYQKYEADKKQRIFYNAYLLSIILMGLFSDIGILSGRGVVALSFAQNFLLADMYSRTKNILLRLLLLMLCISTAAVSMHNIIGFGNMSGQIYTPYTTIFDYGLRLF